MAEFFTFMSAPAAGCIILSIIFTYFGGEVLRTVDLNFKEWLYILGFAFLIVPVDLVRKVIRNLFNDNTII